jgi:serine protease Do
MFKVKIARRDMDQLLASGSDDSGRMESQLGVEVSDITPEISKKFNLGDTDGVIVVNVAPDSKGAKAGIAQGDIIMEINHQPVNDASDYIEIIDDVEKGDAVQMYLRRMNKGYMVVKIFK